MKKRELFYLILFSVFVSLKGDDNGVCWSSELRGNGGFYVRHVEVSEEKSDEDENRAFE